MVLIVMITIAALVVLVHGFSGSEAQVVLVARLKIYLGII